MLQLIVLNVAIVSTLSCLWLWSVRTEVDRIVKDEGRFPVSGVRR